MHTQIFKAFSKVDHSFIFLAERVRQKIEKNVIKIPKVEIKVTVSIGIATPDQPDQLLEEVVNNADTALYQAKNAGRNKVERHKG